MKKQIKIAFAALACVCTLAACRGKKVTAEEARNGVSELTLEKAQEKYTKGKVSVKVTINKVKGDEAKEDAEDIKESAKEANGKEVSKDEMAFYFVDSLLGQGAAGEVLGNATYYLNGTALTVISEATISLFGASGTTKTERRANKLGLIVYEKKVSEAKKDGYELKYTSVTRITWSK